MYNQVCFFENLHAAYLKARKCKRYRSEILSFSYNLEENLLKLQEELLNQSYQHGGYREFIVCDSKKRKIKAAPFRDRVAHHALCNIIEPILDKGFIFDSYACREGKGTRRAIKRLECFIKSANMSLRERERERVNSPAGFVPLESPAISSGFYCLQCDVSKYFESIDHEILAKIIEKKIEDKKTLWLINKIINSNYDRKIHENLFDFRLSGIPIGNLTSQLFANIYLNELDQFVKHKLRAKYYIRYMDDFLILGPNKKNLHQIKKEIQGFSRDRLKLKLHPKKVNIFPVLHHFCHKSGGGGIDFLGYRIFGNYRLLRKSTVKRFVKRTKIYLERLNNGTMNQEKFRQSLQSWLSYAKFGDSWRLRKKLFPNSIDLLPNNI